MIFVYINYPNPHITIHRDPTCGRIQQHQRPGQRVGRIDISSLEGFLAGAIQGQISFAAEAGLNDIWLEIDLPTPEQEIGLVHIFQALIGQRYTPLSTAPVDLHC